MTTNSVMKETSQWRATSLFAVLVGIWLTCSLRINRSASSLPTPTNTQSACKLHYSHFHILWTLPPLVLLFLLNAPFLTRLDRGKLVLLPCIAFVWTTPWDNELVRQGAWWYPKACVLARIGYVPVEEYAFFILQSLVTALLTIWLTRWHTPWMLQRGARWSVLLPLIPCTTMLSGIAGLWSAEGSGRWYYASMIAWWSSAPLVLLWGGIHRSLACTLKLDKLTWPWLASLLLPTLFLCSADVFALRCGTWHISESKSLGIFAVPDLPVEEASFFLVTNLILVSACFTFDRVVWQQRTNEVTSATSERTPMSPTFFVLNWTTLPIIWRAFVSLDQRSDGNAGQLALQKAQAHSLEILRRASKSFHIASMLLPWDLRTDLGYLYALARAMDDFIDAPPQGSVGYADAQDRIRFLQELVRTVFQEGGTVSNKDVKISIENCCSSFTTSASLHKDELQDLSLSAQAASVLRGIVPVHLWHELLQGYATDAQAGGPAFARFEDQAEYAQNVAGSIGEMCVRVILARCGIVVNNEHRVVRDVSRADLVAPSSLSTGKTKLNDASVVKQRHPNATKSALRLDAGVIDGILRDARRMGVSLQLINIARDVYTDAQELRRCYLVVSKDDERKLCGQLFSNGVKDNAGECSTSLFTHKMALVQLAREISARSVRSIDLIPDVPARTGFRVACAVYLGIGQAIERDGTSGCMERSRMSTIERVCVALKAVYFPGHHYQSSR